MNDYRIEKTKDSIIDLKKDIKYIYRNLNNRISNLDKDNIVIKNNLSINDIKEKSFIDEIQKLINNTITLETEINQEIDDKEIILSNCESDKKKGFKRCV